MNINTCNTCKHFGELRDIPYCFLMTSMRDEDDSCEYHETENISELQAEVEKERFYK